jgi:hypothetical protein
MILGEITPFGRHLIPKRYRIGHLDQHIHSRSPPSRGSLAWSARDPRPNLARRDDLRPRVHQEDMNARPAVSGLSGALELAKVLCRAGSALLDEPTNYSTSPIRWLERFLNQWKSG